MIAPFKHFSKLREFVTLKLPKNGFPVKLDSKIYFGYSSIKKYFYIIPENYILVPILPTVTAKVTFQKFEFRENIPAELFVIPDDYKEDNMRLKL